MVAKIINKFAGKMLVIGPFYDRIEIFNLEKSILARQDLVILNSGICYSGISLKEIKQRIKVIDQFSKGHNCIYVLGKEDLLLMNRIRLSYDNHYVFQWFNSKNNVVIINLLGQSRIIVTNGGVTPKMTLQDLCNNIETSFVSSINGLPWHKWYGGKYGYIISNNPLTQEKPKFWNFSLQLGNILQERAMIYAAQINNYGIERIITI